MPTSDEVLDAKSRAAMLREGYDQDEVDAFLDRAMDALGGAASAVGRRPGRPTRTSTPGASAVTEERRGRFGRRRR